MRFVGYCDLDRHALAANAGGTFESTVVVLP